MTQPNYRDFLVLFTTRWGTTGDARYIVTDGPDAREAVKIAAQMDLGDIMIDGIIETTPRAI